MDINRIIRSRFDMRTRMTAAVLVTITVMLLLAPALSTDASADTEGEVIGIETIDGEDASVELQSGGSTTVLLYVTNKTTESVAVQFSSISGFGSDVTASAVITVVGSGSEYQILSPSGENGDVAVITVTLTADAYADAGTAAGELSIIARVLGGSTVETLTVPISITLTSVFTSGDSYNKFFGIIPNTLEEPLDSAWFTAAVTLIIWIILTVVVTEVVVPLLTRLVGNRKTPDEKKRLTKQLTVAMTALMTVIALNECVQIIGASAEVSYYMGAISNIVYVCLSASMSWNIYMFVVTAFLKGLDRNSEVDGMDMSLLPLFKTLGKLVIVVVSVCAILGAFGVDLYGIMVSAGVISLGITLGAQETLNQFFSGIVLLATRPFKAGDFIRIGGETYRVRKIRLMYTELDNWDFDQVVTIPNNTVSSATVINLSSGRRTRVNLDVDVAYGTDIAKAKQCLEAAGRKHPHVIKDGSCTPPVSRFMSFGDSGITLRLYCYVDDFDSSSSFTGQLRELVYKELTSNGIEIPYNRIQVDVLTVPPDERIPFEGREPSYDGLRNPQSDVL